MRSLHGRKSAERSEIVAFFDAEAADRSFWGEELSGIESQLVKLKRAADGGFAATATLQISAKPVAKSIPPTKVNATATAAAAALPAKLAATVAKHAKKDQPLEKIDPTKLAASLGAMPDMKNAMELAPMLAMLKGLYDEGKERIGKMNQREKDSKAKFAKKELDHKAKLAKIEERFKAGKLSQEFRTNETKEENRMFTYWSHCRIRQHKQFHNMLKMQHTTMEREKMMIDMYEKTLSGKADKTKVKQELGQVAGGIPEVVFLQNVRKSVAKFCGETLKEVKAERNDLVAWAAEEKSERSQYWSSIDAGA